MPPLDSQPRIVPIARPTPERPGQRQYAGPSMAISSLWRIRVGRKLASNVVDIEFTVGCNVIHEYLGVINIEVAQRDSADVQEDPGRPLVSVDERIVSRIIQTPQGLVPANTGPSASKHHQRHDRRQSTVPIPQAVIDNRSAPSCQLAHSF